MTPDHDLTDDQLDAMDEVEPDHVVSVPKELNIGKYLCIWYYRGETLVEVLGGDSWRFPEKVAPVVVLQEYIANLS